MNKLATFLIGASIWIPEDSPIVDYNLTTIVIAIAAFVLALIFYAGTIFVLIKFAVALYNFIKASENPQEQAGYKEDMMESLIGGILFYIFVFGTQYVSILALQTFQSNGEYESVINAIKAFWNVFKNARELFGIGF